MKKLKRRSRLWKISSIDFRNVVMSSNSYSDIAKHFNYSLNSSIFDMIKERMKCEGIPLSTIEEAQKIQRNKQLKKLNKNNKKSLEEILVKNSSYNRTHLKNRLLEEGLLEKKCYKCGLGPEWQGEPLSLQLDHKNGINDDNRLENIWLLCPNCHSQTPTFNGKHKYVIRKCKDCGKRINKVAKRCMPCANKLNGSKMAGANNPSCKVKNRPSREELIQLILTKPFVQIGNQFGVSDNAIRKWCKYEGLPSRKKDIEAQREMLQAEIKELVFS